jgi:hypothetical protein
MAFSLKKKIFGATRNVAQGRASLRRRHLEENYQQLASVRLPTAEPCREGEAGNGIEPVAWPAGVDGVIAPQQALVDLIYEAGDLPSRLDAKQEFDLRFDEVLRADSN